MKRILLVIFVLFGFSEFAQAQDSLVTTIDTTSLYSKYREDQFYLGLTFNLLTNKPEAMEQNGFSGGLQFGYIRDMPINKQRNWAIGLGAGISMNTYNQNLFVGETPSEESIFQVIDNQTNYNKNWFTTYLVEAPLQLRWRTSTATTYKFWRIYTGVQLGYMYAYKFYFEQPNNQVTQTDVPEFDRFRMGLTFSFGYDTFNFYFYYNINPMFNDTAQIDGSPIELNSLKLGLMFYIL